MYITYKLQFPLKFLMFSFLLPRAIYDGKDVVPSLKIVINLLRTFFSYLLLKNYIFLVLKFHAIAIHIH